MNYNEFADLITGDNGTYSFTWTEWQEFIAQGGTSTIEDFQPFAEQISHDKKLSLAFLTDENMNVQVHWRKPVGSRAYITWSSDLGVEE